MSNTELPKVQMACVQLVLKMNGENLDIEVRSFGEESLPPKQRYVAETAVQMLYDIIHLAIEITKKNQ